MNSRITIFPDKFDSDTTFPSTSVREKLGALEVDGVDRYVNINKATSIAAMATNGALLILLISYAQPLSWEA
jgi:hypothetical protein